MQNDASPINQRLKNYSHKSATRTPFLILLLGGLVSACGGGNSPTPQSSFNVTTNAGNGGTISPASASVNSNDTVSFSITANSGYSIASVSGCSGTLSGTIYTTAAINANCTVTVSFNSTAGAPIAAAQPLLTLLSPKTFRFSWTDVSDATFYRVLENPDGVSGYSQIGSDISPATQLFDYQVALFMHTASQYILQSCNAQGCTDSAAVSPVPSLVDAIGYFKASNSGLGDGFGQDAALSADASTLAISASWERSNATGVNGDQNNDAAGSSGAVYVFVFDGLNWSQQAYIKASNTGPNDFFGDSIALSSDGNTLAVSAPEELSNATGINGDESDNSLSGAGAVYVFTRSGSSWSQQAYIKASNTEASDRFGTSLTLSDDGNRLAVGARGEDSNAIAVTPQDDNSAAHAGAAYLFMRSGSSWTQSAYLKASNTGAGDLFGWAMDFSGDGQYLAVSAVGEGSNAQGINGNQSDNSMAGAGAVYIFAENNGNWQMQSYIKASNSATDDQFGQSVKLDQDGNTLVVSAVGEDSVATGIDGNQADNSASASGAVYVFTRESNWSQQAYIKASNSASTDQFGWDLALSDDGNRLLAGAFGEDSAASGLEGNQVDDSSLTSGAAYLFQRNAGSWSQVAYIKASNTDTDDQFGRSLSLSGDGNSALVGATREDSNATGINGDASDNSLSGAGAAYLY